MKNSKKIFSVSSCFLILVASGCGKSDDPPVVTSSAALVATCSIGQVYNASACGCMSPVPGSPGYGSCNGTSVAASCWDGTVTMTANGCQPTNNAASACVAGQPGYGGNCGASSYGQNYPEQNYRYRRRHWRYSGENNKL